jgi:hypothetical protein
MGRGRFALVIGNGKYNRPIVRLRNPTGDASAVADILEKSKFKVSHVSNLRSDELVDAIKEFELASAGAEVALVYYSGHGVSISGKNFLLPTDATIATEADVSKFVSVENLIASLTNSSDATLFFLDACRSSISTAGETEEEEDGDSQPRKIEIGAVKLAEGLAEIHLPKNYKDVFIYFAAAPNSVAYDGKGEHSPFTTALIENIGIRGLSLEEMSIRINASVRRQTNGKQRPWPSHCMTRSFYFRKKDSLPAIAMTVLGLGSGYLGSVLLSHDPSNLFGVPMLPGLLFGLVVYLGLYIWGGKGIPSLAILFTVCAWTLASLTYSTLLVELPKIADNAKIAILEIATTRTDIPLRAAEAVSSGELKEEERDSFVKQESLRLDIEERSAKRKVAVLAGATGEIAAVLAGFVGAIITVVGCALCTRSARNPVNALAIGVLGGLSVLAYGAYFDYTQTLFQAGLMAFWQASVAGAIGLNISRFVQKSSKTVIPYFYWPTIDRSKLWMIILLALAGAASSALFEDNTGSKAAISNMLNILGTPFEPSICFGAALTFVVAKYQSRSTMHLFVFGATQLAWLAGFQTAFTLGPDLPMLYALSAGGFVGSGLLVAMLSLVSPQLRHPSNFLVVTFVGTALALQHAMLNEYGLTQFLQFEVVGNLFAWMTLFVPWQMFVGAALIYGYERPGMNDADWA